MPSGASRVRQPAVAGRFYAADPERCAEDVRRLCDGREPHAEDARAAENTRAAAYGAIVPHAGWICSGHVAGRTLAALAERSGAKTIVLTGSVHTMAVLGPALETADAWWTPLGPVEVDAELRRTLAELPGFEPLDMAHQHEHSLEVQLPFIRRAFGEDARIVPCLIPEHTDAPRWGRMIGEVLAQHTEPAVMIASSDLTHYGPNYRFTPEGTGEAGCRWALEINDRRLIDQMEAMDAEAIVPETRQRKNACGGGAIAATVACCETLGAERGKLLEHTNSTRVLAEIGRADPNNAVGYAGLIFE